MTSGDIFCTGCKGLNSRKLEVVCCSRVCIGDLCVQAVDDSLLEEEQLTRKLNRHTRSPILEIVLLFRYFR